MIVRVVAVVVLVMVCVAPRAYAVPAFAQQTGQPCSACHIGSFGPQLTPLGRTFKIGGYTQTGGEGLASKIPLSAMLLPPLPIRVLDSRAEPHRTSATITMWLWIR